MSALLVTADDFGLHTSVNLAINNCVLFGSVNSVSVIANGKELDFGMLQGFISKKILVGAHITWVGESWLTEPIFIADWQTLVRRIITSGAAFREKMKIEAEAQIVRLINGGIFPKHIDSHQHIHHFPGVWNVVQHLMLKYDIPRIRVAHVKSYYQTRKEISGIILNILAKIRHDDSNNFYCAGIKHAGNYTFDLFNQELQIASGYDTELIVHPGFSNYELNKQYSTWNFDWETEYNALIRPEFLKMVKMLGFEYE